MIQNWRARAGPQYLLGDGLGSRRGVTDLAGTLAGTADYDTFGAVRTTSGAGSPFGFTGEQLDSEAGYTYLRARYLNPALGRFVSADSVQPNAPGTQGFNLYVYVGNNPSTWIDPSGHEVDPRHVYITALVMARPAFIATATVFCEAIAATVGGAGAAAASPTGPGGASIALSAAGNAFAVCQTLVMVMIAAPAISCALDKECLMKAWDYAGAIRAGGGQFGSYADTNTWDKIKNWAREWPFTPLAPVVELLRQLASIIIETKEDCDATRDRCLDEGWYFGPEWPDEGIFCFACWSYCLFNLEWPDHLCPERKNDAEVNSALSVLANRYVRSSNTSNEDCGGGF